MLNFLSVFPARLNGYKLIFNYFSTSRNAGAANIMESKENCVYGLLIDLEEDSIQTIRNKEGYPSFYDEIRVEVENFDNTKILDVITYKVMKNHEKPEHQPPTRYYLQLLIRNAKKYGFPTDYIKYLESIETIG